MMPKAQMDDKVILGAASAEGLVPLLVSPALADAIETLIEFLRENPKWCKRAELALERLQPSMGCGPWVDVLRALVGE